MGISVIGGAPPAGAKEKRVVLFTATGSWTAPAGVTYAIAHILPGGGGGGSLRGSGSVGSTSAAFGQNALGGSGGVHSSATDDAGFLISGISGQANTGNGGSSNGWNGGASGTYRPSDGGRDSRLITFGATVIPGTNYTITVGAGGAAASLAGAGGSGHVSIEFYV